jgi:hypothetical protein
MVQTTELLDGRELKIPGSLHKAIAIGMREGWGGMKNQEKEKFAAVFVSPESVIKHAAFLSDSPTLRTLISQDLLLKERCKL